MQGTPIFNSTPPNSEGIDGLVNLRASGNRSRFLLLFTPLFGKSGSLLIDQQYVFDSSNKSATKRCGVVASKRPAPSAARKEVIWKESRSLSVFIT